LEPAVLAFAWQKIHLQEALIGLFLDFNQVGDLDSPLDFGEIQPLAFPNMLVAIGHA
jgi:hypothetical protein